MTTIAQRDLRNDVAAILRRAQAGERFTVTVNGRPVAALGPLPSSEPRRSFAELIATTPVDREWSDDLRALRDGEHAGS